MTCIVTSLCSHLFNLSTIHGCSTPFQCYTDCLKTYLSLPGLDLATNDRAEDMPGAAIKLYSAVFKVLLRHKLLSCSQTTTKDHGVSALSRRSGINGVPANAAFVDGVATKDIYINPLTSLSVRIFLPQSALSEDSSDGPQNTTSLGFPFGECGNVEVGSDIYGWEVNHVHERMEIQVTKMTWECSDEALQRTENINELNDAECGAFTPNKRKPRDGRTLYHGHYQGYLPCASATVHKKLPVILQFHGGAFVTGSKDSAANDLFCRRMAKLCDAIVIAVGYRLAPEYKYPAAFDDGFEALCWLAKQANLADCHKSLEHIPAGHTRNQSHIHGGNLHKGLIDSFGASVVEPWLAAHSDPSRCVLLGVSSGGNIADCVARKAVLARKLLDPVKVVSQVLMYPFFTGSIPTGSEVKMANSYFFDKATCMLAWKLFLEDGEYKTDHQAANPLLPERDLPLKLMPPTLTVVAELDWMKDRAIAYSEALRKVNIDAPVLEYKDAVHEFATLDFLVESRQAEACAEDMAIWMRKYTSSKGNELSY